MSKLEEQSRTSNRYIKADTIVVKNCENASFIQAFFLKRYHL